jgi:hypothetical protein
MRWFTASIFTIVLSIPCYGETPKTIEDDFGVLNPQDTGVAMIKRKVAMGVIDSVTCSLGINVTKINDHVLARKLTKQCAEAGFTKAMTWMSQLEDNGMGGDYDPVASAQWDRRAAQAGDPIGKFNYGLDLMRGHGVALDEEMGRDFVDQAAKDGLAIAKRLQGADYDLDVVTPDSDDWKYGLFY